MCEKEREEEEKEEKKREGGLGKEREEGIGSIGNTVNLVLISATQFFSPLLAAADTVFLVLPVTRRKLRAQTQHESRRRDKIDSALAVCVQFVFPSQT